MTERKHPRGDVQISRFFASVSTGLHLQCIGVSRSQYIYAIVIPLLALLIVPTLVSSPRQMLNPSGGSLVVCSSEKFGAAP